MSKKSTVVLLLGIAVTCGLIIHFTKEPVGTEAITDASNDSFPLESTTSPAIVVTPTEPTPTPTVPADTPTSPDTSVSDDGSTSSGINEPVIPPPLPPDSGEPGAGSQPVSKGQCRPGGCSGQLCTDQPDMASTCEWREEYACYQRATCERQASGQCGWTETPELKQCLSNTASNPTI